MKMAKKILSTVLAGAMLMGSALITQAASDENLFTEGFESVTTATGGAVDTTTFRNGNASYCIVTEEGKDAELIIPMADMAESIVGKHIVVEAWYHIEGELAGYKEVEMPGETEGTTVKVPTGEQVTMAYYKDGETVESFKGKVGTVYAMENAVYPNTDTAGWHRIRIAGIPKDEGAGADYSDNKLVVQLQGADENVKLYVDDVRMFVTDNMADMVSKGNSDFDTYTAIGINGWTLWDTDPSQPQNLKGYVEYSKSYATTGEYSIKLTRNNVAGAFGLQNGLCLEDYGVTTGMNVATGVDSRGEYNNGESYKALKIRAVHLAISSEYSWFAEKQKKTSYTINTVGTSTNGLLTVGRGNYFDKDIPSMTDSASFVYLDSLVLKAVGDGFCGLKENTETNKGNKTDNCSTVKELSHGDVVYPYAMFAAKPIVGTSLIVARYSKDQNGTMKLDDISVNESTGYSSDITFDWLTSPNISTAAITVPESGQYLYKVMVWGEMGGMNTLLDTAVYEVK